jgi:hypothetical protein
MGILPIELINNYVIYLCRPTIKNSFRMKIFLSARIYANARFYDEKETSRLLRL